MTETLAMSKTQYGWLWTPTKHTPGLIYVKREIQMLMYLFQGFSAHHLIDLLAFNLLLNCHRSGCHGTLWERCS